MNTPDKKSAMPIPAIAPPVTSPADTPVVKVVRKVTRTVKKTAEAVNPAAPPVVKTVKVSKEAGSVKTSSSAAMPVPEPLKPGRRSSVRTIPPSTPLAPMVPTHAPDAAKASYSTMPERLITPLIQAAAPKDPKLANNWKSKSADQLSDEEVKSMPDEEYMNDAQLAFFRHKLSILKQEIHNSAGETTEHLREDAAVVPDPADRATIEEEHALELRTRDRERKLLKKIEQSIARIDSGDYGYCDETGEPIGVGRLIARPTANLSLEAQQRRELKQKMFGD